MLLRILAVLDCTVLASEGLHRDQMVIVNVLKYRLWFNFTT